MRNAFPIVVYHPEKNGRKDGIKKHEESSCRTLMIKNKLVSDIEKEESQKEETAYYSFTETVENYILVKQYHKAKEQYHLLQQKYQSLFARDIHNATRCAILSRDFKNAFWWAKKLAYKGISLPYFNSKIFNVLKETRNGKASM